MKNFFAKNSKWLFGLTSICVVAIGIFTWWNLSGESMFAAAQASESNEPVETRRTVVVTKVQHSTTKGEKKTYPGTINARTSARMAFRVGGPLIEVNVAPGDDIQRGQLLMRIDPRDFQNRVEAAKAALASATARQLAMNNGARSEDLAMLEAKRSALRSRQANLNTEFQRNARLITENAVSRSEYDASKTALEAIESEILAADEDLKKAKSGARKEDRQSMSAEIKALEVQLKTAEDQLSDTKLIAPFSGTVSKQLVENFEAIQPGQDVLVIHDISSLEVKIALPEKDVIHRAFDETFTARVQLLASPDSQLIATFKENDTLADRQTRTYQTTFTLAPTPGINVFPGMVAEVQIDDASVLESESQLIVPVTAIQGDESGERFVWVLDNDKVQKRIVKLGGLVNATQQLVLDGLKEDESIVISGGAFIHDGEAVAAMQKN